MISQGPLQINRWEVPNENYFEGKYCRLERLNPLHFDDIYRVRVVDDASTRYQYLFSLPPPDKVSFIKHMTDLMNSTTFIAYAVIDKKTGRAEGIQSYLTINPMHGSIEIGGILWGPEISRTPVTTEAFYLFSKHIFEDLEYRRYEWKCNNANSASKSAALRFGFQFEGIFRQHMIQNGWNRDTAYFSMLDSEWPLHKRSLEIWLDSSNFDENGIQLNRLQEIREGLAD